MTRRPFTGVLICIQLCYEHTILYFLISDIGNGNKGGFIITLKTSSRNGLFVLAFWITSWGSLHFSPHCPMSRVSCTLHSPTRQPLFHSSRSAGSELQQEKKVDADKNKISMYNNTKTSNITLSFSLPLCFILQYILHVITRQLYVVKVNVWILHLWCTVIPPQSYHSSPKCVFLNFFKILNFPTTS